MTVFIAKQKFTWNTDNWYCTLYTIIIYQTSIHPNRDFTILFYLAHRLENADLDIVTTRAERPLDVNSKDLGLRAECYYLCKLRQVTWILCNLDSCLTVMLYRILCMSFAMIYFLFCFVFLCNVPQDATLFSQNTAHDFNIVRGKMRKYRSQSVLQVIRSKNNFILGAKYCPSTGKITHLLLLWGRLIQELVSFDCGCSLLPTFISYYLLNLTLHSQ